MNRSELLNELKKEARYISNEDLSLARAAIMGAVEHVPEPYKTIYSSDYFTFLYENFLRLKGHKEIGIEEELDAEEYASLLGSIKDKSYPDDRKREALTRLSSLVLAYLVFIVKEPLHPVGMIFPGGMRITQKEPHYYCPVKGKQSETNISFCEFCICKDNSELE
ncbi:DUF2115 domain-containing protein [Methanolobus mangrovi]|uniref:UPF0305 protein RE476_02465 n=1 Tax=Methanolobus mangrovi TaxID=3072977 RepID=A0AA51UIE8_9EURY|nr:DUF2115 domain-containing protein [Methanolobus mangrovi]WMW22702.1 DUF2115 domain-containing protein [Methanolobus mangrovi]